MPTAYQAHVDTVLSGLAKEYKNEAYVADVLFPRFNVSKLSDIYPIYHREDSMSVPETTLGPRSVARTVDWRQSTGTYSCQLQGLKKAISQWEINNSDDPYARLRMRATNFVQDQLLLRLEYEVATLATTTGTYGSNYATLSGTDQWNYSGADSTANIVEDIDNAIKACAVPPNTMVIGKLVWDVMKRDAALLEAIKYTERAILTPQHIGAMFDIDKVVVAKAQSSTPAGVLSYLWGKNVIVARTESPSMETVAFGFNFVNGQSHKVRTWTDPAIGGGSEIIEVNWAWDPRVFAQDCGYLINAAIS